MNTLRPYTSPPPLRTLLSPHPRVVTRYLNLARASPPPSAAPLLSSPSTHWLVLTDRPPALSKAEVIDYYVATLARVLGSEREAQACIYDASWQTHFGFCCDVDEEASSQLASLPNVISVRRDASPESSKDYSFASSLLDQLGRANRQITEFLPSGSGGNGKYWLVQMEKPGFEVVTKAHMVDYYTHILAKVLGNEQDAQVSIYNISWEKNFGFCCHIDEDCAEELSVVPGVMSVRPDLHYDSQYKDYGGIAILQKEDDELDPSKSNQITDIKTKRLFVTGLSFYTSEKTLRAAFEGFGELVEVKVIMDKISKRSKGYAFIEYKTEAAAGAALKEMNGKIINGWMIVVDVAKTNPQKMSRGRPRTP